LVPTLVHYLLKGWPLAASFSPPEGGFRLIFPRNIGLALAQFQAMGPNELT
jgi:hypothetical protein